MKVLTIVIAAAAALLFSGHSGARRPPQLGVVLNGLDNPYFVAMYQGVKDEAARRDVPVSFKAPQSHSDVAGQTAEVRAILASKKDCYAMSPIDPAQLVSTLRGVRKPVVFLDSPLDRATARKAGLRIATAIGSSDFGAGRLAGTEMVSLLHGTGQVALLGGFPTGNGALRLDGFQRAIAGTGVHVVARANAGYVRVKAEAEAAEMLHKHPQLAGFFAANDLMALGAADAVSAAGKTGEVAIVGMDGITEALDAIRSGEMSATVSQYPYVMGRMAVEACLAAARGAVLPSRVDAPVAVVTRANVARATAMFPRPFQTYSDPFARLLRS
ncbi:MAG TPA: substrate-binding domain-containing protein [Actinomycetota bacterium]|nr:substrate-binding domain-containing protein [Actinomycetota bacterium]